MNTNTNNINDNINNNKQIIVKPNDIITVIEQYMKSELKIIAVNYNFIQIVDIAINSYIKRLFQY